MKKINFYTVLMALTFIPFFAIALSIRCEFLERAHLKGFRAVLSESSAKIHFEGDVDYDSDLNPSGESVTLIRSEAAIGWIIYSGEEVFPKDSPCIDSSGKGCAPPARRFSLNLPAIVLKGEKVQGSLHFTRLSEYLPGETDFFYTVNCSPRPN